MTHVIVHAGYHKTGTTSLQDFLTQNKDALAPYLTSYGKTDFLNAGAAARIYAQKPFPHRLYAFRRSLRKFLASIPDDPMIVLSRETFSGGMPGHRTFSGRVMTSYFGPSQKLAHVIIAELRRRFGAEVAITFFYTTREREAWIRSVHGHLLRSIRLTDDFKAFRARFPALLGPEEEAQRMAAAISPIPVVTAALEDHARHRLGAATAILDIAGVPKDIRATLSPAPASNPGEPDDLREGYLALNRSTVKKSALKAAKEHLSREQRQ